MFLFTSRLALIRCLINTLLSELSVWRRAKIILKKTDEWHIDKNFLQDNPAGNVTAVYCGVFLNLPQALLDNNLLAKE
jgi:hypothetical protein